MKMAIIIPDGCADDPLPQLGGRTPLQAARTPGMDEIARLGIIGRTDNVPRHFPAGSEVANMTLFGYNPNIYFTGRAPIEAAAQGIQLGPNDWAIRCNLVTVENQVMVDFTADHISTADASELLAYAQSQMHSDEFQFVPGVSYRNLLLYRPESGSVPLFSTETRTRAPHDLTDLSVADDYPRGPGSDVLSEIMRDSGRWFASHAINTRRKSEGKRPATHVWLWGLGRSPSLPAFYDRFGMRGAMITAVDLLRGIAALIGWDRIEVDGATGYLDTNYAGKGEAAIETLQSHDIVCVHVEATDEASHEGRTDEKILALERIDEHIVRPVHEALRKYGDYRILVLPDHRTPVSTKKHSHGLVPFACCGSGITAGAATTYDEISAQQSPIEFSNGWEMMSAFVHGGFSTRS